MSPRFICPHCHNSIDPLTLDLAHSAEAQYRICPECDEAVVLSVSRNDADDELPLLPADTSSRSVATESLAR